MYGLMSAGGSSQASYTLNMQKPNVLSCILTITFHKKGTFQISGSYDAGWICTTTITCKGVQRGSVSNGNSGSLNFIVDVVPNDTFIINQTTDQQNESNRYCHTNLSINKLK